MLAKSAKEKGKRFERELADWMTKITNCKWNRTPMSGALHQNFPFDCIKTERNKETIFDNVGNEAKNTKEIRMKEWIDQIEIAYEDYLQMPYGLEEWFICFRYKGKMYFTIPKYYFEKLLKFYKFYRNEINSSGSKRSS